MFRKTLDEPRSHRARTILRLAGEDTPRTLQELAEAAGVTRQYAHSVLRRYAPHLSTRGVTPRSVARCAWCGREFEPTQSRVTHCSRTCARRALSERAFAEDRDTKGRAAYEARAASPGTTWREIAGLVGVQDAHHAITAAKEYARRRSLPWPLARKGKKDSGLRT